MSKHIDIVTLKSYPHHNMLKYCENRPKYRQGRKLTAVKVYTVNDESQHLLISGVPSVNLHDEMEKLCTRYGNVMSINQVQLEDQEDFTHSFHVVFFRIQSARFAKKQIDTKNFFGSVLHVCYAPELESIEQTRAKLQMRITEVTKYMNRTGVENNYKKELSQQIPVTADENLKFQDLSSYSQKHNRWLKGGLKCSYIIPKTDPLNTTKEIIKHKLETIKESTKLNSKTSMFIPRQLSTASSTTKTKKPNRIIFHL